MANKYKDYEKCMMSFTVPNVVIKSQGGIKNGRYSKMRELVNIKKDLAKLLSREDIKYFMNIELGKAYSNPHLHVQVWSATSANLSNISKKICTKYNLNQNRCPITYQDEDSDIDVFHYVVKDYAKNLSDDEIWNLDVQKKRYRKQYGKVIRFYSKSSDRFTKRWYRFAYRYYGVLRDRADIFLERFLSIFSFWNKREVLKVRTFCFVYWQVMFIYNKRRIYVFNFVFKVETAARDPPLVKFIIILKIDRKEVVFLNIIIFIIHFMVFLFGIVFGLIFFDWEFSKSLIVSFLFSLYGYVGFYVIEFVRIYFGKCKCKYCGKVED